MILRKYLVLTAILASISSGAINASSSGVVLAAVEGEESQAKPSYPFTLTKNFGPVVNLCETYHLVDGKKSQVFIAHHSHEEKTKERILMYVPPFRPILIYQGPGIFSTRQYFAYATKDEIALEADTSLTYLKKHVFESPFKVAPEIIDIIKIGKSVCVRWKASGSDNNDKKVTVFSA